MSVAKTSVYFRIRGAPGTFTIVFRRIAVPSTLLLTLSSFACGNKDYEKCVENEAKSEAEHLERVAKCAEKPDEAAKKACTAEAESKHFKAGCEALK